MCLKGGVTYFYEFKLQNKSRTETSASFYGNQHYFKKDIRLSWLRKKRNVLEIQWSHKMLTEFPFLLFSYHTYIMIEKA